MTISNRPNGTPLLRRLLDAALRHFQRPQQTSGNETVDPAALIESDAPEPVHKTDQPQKPISFQGLSNLTVLVVEDVDANRQSICTMLEELGHRIIEATDGSEAIALAETRQPDVILMDISLPLMDGWKATKFLREHHNSQLAALPIIAMTNQLVHGRQEHTSGMSGFLTKPFDIDQLTEALKQATIESAFEASDEPDQTDQEDTPLLDLAVFSQDGDPSDHNQSIELIDSFVATAPALAAAIHDAPNIAVQCQQAEILKGAANNVGLMRLAQIALKVEKGAPPEGLERTLKESLRQLQEARQMLSSVR